MEQYYLGIDAGSSDTRLVLMGERKKIVKRCKINSKENIAQAEKNILFKDLDDSAMILGIGITGVRRYAQSIKADISLSRIFSLAVAGKNYLSGVKTIIESGTEKSEVIMLDNNSIEDFCTVKNTSFQVLRKMNIQAPILFLGNRNQYLSIRDFVKKEIIVEEKNEYFASLGACLAAKQKISQRNAVNYKGKISGDEMSFKTINCNGCTNHCALSALIFNGQIKATFGALCDNPKIYNNMYLKKI